MAVVQKALDSYAIEGALSEEGVQCKKVISTARGKLALSEGSTSTFVSGASRIAVCSMRVVYCVMPNLLYYYYTTVTGSARRACRRPRRFRRD